MPVSFRYKKDREFDLEKSERHLALVPVEIPEGEIKSAPEDLQLFNPEEKVETEKGLGRLLDFVRGHLVRKKALNSKDNSKNLKIVRTYQMVQNPEEVQQKGLQLKKAA